MPKYVQEFTVVPLRETGMFNFPIDMLRYDHCHPATETDSIAISVTFDKRHDIESFTQSYGSIKLTRIVEHKDQVPTEGRWRSFGWYVNCVLLRKI